MASVIGREFDLKVLNALTGDFRRHELLDVLEEALSAQVIEELPAAVGRYQFSHVLIQETLARGVSATRRADLHGLVGEALEQLYGPASALHSAELAFHFAEASPVTGTEKMVRYSIMAGEQALSTYAYEDALDYFQRVLDAKQGKPADAETASALFGLAKAQGAAGQVHQAWDNMNRAFDYYFKAGEAERAVTVSQYPLFYTSGVPDIQKMVTQALTLVAPDSIQAGRLLARHGLLINLETGDYRRAQDALDRALAIARAEGDVSLEIQALTNAADVDWYHLRWQNVISRSMQAIDLAGRHNDLHAEAWPHFLTASAYWFLGCLPEAQRHSEAMLRLSERLRNRGFLAHALFMNSSLAQSVGDWKVARELSQRGLEVAPEFGWLLTRGVMLEYQTGDFEAGETFLQRLLDLMRQTPPGPIGEYTTVAGVIPAIAYIRGRASRFNVAKEAIEVVLSSPNAAPMVAITAKTGLAWMAIMQEDVEAAREQYEALLPWQGTFGDEADWTIDHSLGLLARTTGQYDKAVVHFEVALRLSKEAGYQPELAWVCYDYANTLLLASGLKPDPAPENRARAVSLLEEGLAIASQLGMPPLLEKIISLKKRADSLGGPPIALYPDSLTQRKVDVLRLLAAGKSTQQIAEELVVSVHTVIYLCGIFSPRPAPLTGLKQPLTPYIMA
jgi:tetratricopeptide (TPR) repeat protein